MAQAERTTKTVQHVITTEEPVIILELTPEEAAGLKCMMQRIGGNPDNSIRKHSDAINDALVGAGITWQKTSCHDNADSIYFKEDTLKDLIF